jgi:signal peptidase II
MSVPPTEADCRSTPQTGSPTALRARAWISLLVLVAVCAFLDVLAKDWAFERVSENGGRPITVIDGFFYIVHATNTGAMWSLFQGVQREVWIVIRGGVFLILLSLVLRNMPTALWARLGFAFVLAGALGNLHDNLLFEDGAVRDWLRFDFGDWSFPIFNLADTFICIGAPLLLLHFYKQDDNPRESAA